MPITRILIIEDNPMDVRLLGYAFEQNPEWRVEIASVIEDGENAVEYFSQQHEDLPDLIILDLNLPRRSGIEVLRTIRGAPSPRQVPVIIFSSSPEDVIRSKVHEAQVFADCYITKPAGLDEFVALPNRFRECYTSSRLRSAKAHE